MTTHHQSLHIRIKDPCEQFDYQATDKLDLTQHYQLVHKGKYGCDQCEFLATHKSHLTSNFQALHMGRKISLLHTRSACIIRVLDVYVSNVTILQIGNQISIDIIS